MTKRNVRFFAFCLMMCICLTCIACDGKTPEDDSSSHDNQKPDKGNDNQNKKEKEKEEESLPSYTRIVLQNNIDGVPLNTRSYYPDTNAFLSKLETLKNAVSKKEISSDAVASELRAAMRNAEGLGLYYDYYQHTHYQDGDTVYGVIEGEYALGGGDKFRSNLKNNIKLVYDDNTLKETLQKAKSGDVICIADNVVIDMSDFIQAGDTTGYESVFQPGVSSGAQSGQKNTIGKIKYEMKIPAGVTLTGFRGETGYKGGMIKVTSYTNIVVVLEEGATMVGVVLQGPDTWDNVNNEPTNLSSGIEIRGNNARILNCEISGFYRMGISAQNVTGVEISYNYIHHILGRETGIAIYANNSEINLHHNLFSNCSRLVSANGDKTQITFEHNMDCGNITNSYFLMNPTNTYDTEYTKARLGIDQCIIRNNTFLSPIALADMKSLAKEMIIEHNLFAYSEEVYRFNPLKINSVTASIYDGRINMQQNVFDILSPQVFSRASSHTKTSEVPYSTKQSVSLTPFEITSKPAVDPGYKEIIQPLVLSVTYYSMDNDSPYVFISELLKLPGKQSHTLIVNSLQACITMLGAYTHYPAYVNGKISYVVNKETYGAHENDGNPIGGGKGYESIFTTGDYVVKDKSELLLAISKVKSGEIIFIEGNAVIDISDATSETLTSLTLPAGVILASNRGYVYEDGSVSTGAIIKSTAFASRPMITVANDNIRISGLVIQGPDPAQHLALWDRCFKSGGPLLGHPYYYNLVMVSGISVIGMNFECDNCEISGFNSSAISLGGSAEKPSKMAKIHHNYIHHNQIKGLGYGVSHGYGYSEIYGNMFNYNRHSIAGSGQAQSRYTAYCNIEFGESLGHYFDMHGRWDRNDRTFYNNAIYGYRSQYFTNLYDYQGSRVPRLIVGKNLWGISGTPELLVNVY